jgi:hypothetical protein
MKFYACNSMDKSLKWNKPDIKGQMSYDSSYGLERKVKFVETGYRMVNSRGWDKRNSGNYNLVGIVSA